MILVLGLTPTVQRTQRFTTLRVGEVNRAVETVVTASGKGTNVAQVVATVGGTVKLVTVLGGDSGRYLARELERAGVPTAIIWDEDDAPTRTCLTILPADGPATELVEEAQPVSRHDLALIRATCTTALLEASVLCCSGSLPTGVPETFYAESVTESKTLGIPAVVDAQKGPLRSALAAGPFLVKPNREEAAATLGLPLTGNATADAQAAAHELVRAGAQWALVSTGRTGAVLTNGSEDWQIVPPSVEVRNPIGSGDSLTAGFLVAHFQRGLPVPESVAYGTACAAANCLTLTSGVVRPEDVERLLPAVTLRLL